MEKPKEGLANWAVLKISKKFLDRYLEIVASDPVEVKSVVPLIQEFYDSTTQEELVYWHLILGELPTLFKREEVYSGRILTGQIKWESK